MQTKSPHYTEQYLLGCEPEKSNKNVSTFRRNAVPHLQVCHRCNNQERSWAACLAYPLNIEDGGICNSESSANFCRTTIPKEVTLHEQRCEKLKPLLRVNFINFMQRTHINCSRHRTRTLSCYWLLGNNKRDEQNFDLTESRVNANCQANEKMVPYEMTAAGFFNWAGMHQYQINLLTVPALVLMPSNGRSLLITLWGDMPLYDTATK
jgi:hypothetical protein